ncbi:MAG: glutathione S-transferase family protein, partial [Rhodobacteraceae bacterium]|nr:glutathione S-transferase family protein [Paracoccaceae bacterium]
AQYIKESGGPWLYGDTISLSDLAIMPVVVRMDDINLGNLWDKYPAINLWLELIQETTPYKATYYQGSLLTEKYPHLAKLKQKTN